MRAVRGATNLRRRRARFGVSPPIVPAAQSDEDPDSRADQTTGLNLQIVVQDEEGSQGTVPETGRKSGG